ncbi:response regulator [Granulicella aggregans]|jgi:DNA-binding NarL/FixJ family response regulator|uniref:response regulator n=1 Tax=Granulicella aggregans TaxID=474949 RepID=UPI0021DFAE4E|nr:response regulator transcription factor [Granulicella aggregans]
MSERGMIRVLIVDDHPLMVAGLSGEINAQRDMCVVAEAGGGEEALLQFRVHRPDVTLMDIRMPGVNGIDAITTIRAEYPRARIVVLSSSAGDIQVLKSFKAGAVGYLLKNLLRTELIETIRTVHAGHRRIPPEIAQQLAAHAAEDALTARELEVLRGVVKGQSNKMIGSELHIAEHTVKNHVKSILSKLDADDRTGAAVMALRRGYIDL